MEQKQTVVIFRSRLDPSASAEYRATAERMETLARSMPGFISFKTFSAPDGERVLIVEFESEQTLTAWRNHPEHVDAQHRGRQMFYLEYRIQVLAPIRERTFKRSQGDASR
jgi:heme-degrading monooxygenase HmoA